MKDARVPCPRLGVGMKTQHRHGHSEQWEWHARRFEISPKESQSI
jgi:hypothetical protein